ncbi:glycosyltransferase family 2 protein [Cryobacterium sp. SO2]|uniref:glycosyltransferase family 2 protein n=1 Tax=Cryobacterium sp. SO2 TaxID=1897060 RepID=UPI00223CC39D|nr:glycosyltransferase family 2 protein [Cryobacterium sp. SO2]WEO77957.1 glycosyltransferase family 2 protein [Cryobacterium sp. SO2]
MNERNRYVKPAPAIDPVLAAYANEFNEMVEGLPTFRPTIGCIIPAYNEADSIAGVLDSLLAQTRLPDVIHVVVNNTTDNTIEIASKYAGPHEVVTDGIMQFTEIFVHDIGENPDKKVGALNYGYSLIEGCDYLLGVDGDTTASTNAVEQLEAEIASDSRVGGISAIYSIDDTVIHGVIASFLISGQRAQFAAFNMQNMLRGRNMAVLGGQFSIFATKALREVMVDSHQATPWVKDSEVEDSLLSLQIKSAGYLTKISAQARANVGGMTTLRGLDAQQVKWNFGAIELMWPGQRGDTKGQPFHPNLRLRWIENFSMVINVVTRVLFFILLAASLSIGAFVFSPVWLIPPAVALLLNFRTAMSMKNRNGKDIFFALGFFPAEIYMWVRIGHFLRAWTKFASNKQVDNWAEQAKAERGSGNAYLVPLLVAVGFSAALVFIWLQLPVVIQSTVLWIGWPILGVTTVLQTLTMFFTLVKRHHGYKV